jgi:YD repeat-containing protein
MIYLKRIQKVILIIKTIMKSNPYHFLILMVISSIFCTSILGQSPNLIELPNFTPRTPVSTAFDRYGEYPVSMYTGVPEISIPLFEIKTSKFTIPITLTYHASGIKVNDFASWVGLGWSLNAGGRVSRKVMGEDDLNNRRNVRDSSSIHPEDSTGVDLDWLRLVLAKAGDDTEPDIYTYDFPGKSGQFLFDNSKKPIMIPYSGVKVAGYYTPNRLIDENGNTYNFDQTDGLQVFYTDRDHAPVPINEWFLTKMVDAGKTDSVRIDYKTLGVAVQGLDYYDYTVLDDNATFSLSYPWVPAYQHGNSGSISATITSYGDDFVPSKIDFSQGIVKFIPSATNRLDRPYIDYVTGFKSLDRIEIYSKEDTTTPIKTILFYESYFINSSEPDTSGNKRLKLDSLRILDKSSHVVQRYKFDYNTTFKLPTYSSKSKDLWGYFNGKTNDNLLPRMTVDFINDNFYGNQGNTTQVTIGSSNQTGRDPSEEQMQAYILKQITFPTGGYTTFNYETNKYLDGQTSKLAGGLRISEVKSYNESGICSKKSYKYGDNESGYGRFNVFLNDFYYCSPALVYIREAWSGQGGGTEGTKRTRTFTSTPCTDLNPFDGSPVVYSTVTEYTGDATNNIGKVIYKYKDAEHDSLGFYVSVDKSFRFNKSFRRGLLESKTTFKKEGNSFQKIYSLENSYFAFPSRYKYLSLKVVQRYDYDGYRTSNDYNDYAYVNTPMFLGDNLLTSTSEHYYDMNDTSNYVVKTTRYHYNDTINTQVSSMTTNTSSQDSLTTFIKHPTDFLNDSFYHEMADTNRNIIAVPVQEFQVRNQTDTLYGKRTNYHKYFQDLFSPKSVDFKTGTNPWETRILYSSYDQSGNLLSAKKDKDIPISYKYNEYNQPIAEVANADTNTFYFNDFENSDGNSNLDDCKTGRKSRTGGFSKSLTGLQSGTYILSWWSKSSGVWNFNSTNVAISGSYTISLSGQVDDVRFYINNSTMKTYTYDPLIGITSSTDENNITTYYEYDPFGRLKYIKDQNKNILKSYDYHYKYQAVNP